MQGKGKNAQMSAKHVLIVEDERPLAHALDLKLQHEGFATSVVHNGQDALDEIKKGGYDVVLLDMMMPVLDGFHVLQEVKDMPDKPVIFVLSNLSQHEDSSRVVEAGARKYFVKSDTPLSVIVEEVKNA